MARVQLALNVSDLAGSVDFYSKLFGVAPHKERPGYANFQVQDPPLKLVLIEVPEADRGSGTGGALNHLGVEVSTTEQVTEAIENLDDQDLPVQPEMATNCCYAQQDKAWVHDPAGTPWEVYTITDDTPQTEVSLAGDGACCTPEPQLHSIGAAPAGTTSCC